MLAAIFDLKFDRTITRQIVGIVYAIQLAVIAFVGFISLLAALFAAEGFWARIGGVIVVLLVSLLAVLVARVVSESVAVFFRVADDVRAIREVSGPRINSTHPNNPSE